MNEMNETIQGCHQNILRSLKDLSGAVVADSEGAHSLRLIGFLRHRLLPHMRSEERHLYPLVDAFATRHNTCLGATMTIDHQFVERQINLIEERLGAARLDHACNSEQRTVSRELEHLLVELSTALRLHLRTEEQVYLGVLKNYANDGAGSEMQRRIQHVYRECDANPVSIGVAV